MDSINLAHDRKGRTLAGIGLILLFFSQMLDGLDSCLFPFWHGISEYDKVIAPILYHSHIFILLIGVAMILCTRRIWAVGKVFGYIYAGLVLTGYILWIANATFTDAAVAGIFFSLKALFSISVFIVFIWFVRTWLAIKIIASAAKVIVLIVRLVLPFALDALDYYYDYGLIPFVSGTTYLLLASICLVLSVIWMKKDKENEAPRAERRA